MMKIGIDVSQLAFPNTGVANYLFNLVNQMLTLDQENEYILFFSSMRGKIGDEYISLLEYPNVKFKSFSLPPTVLELLWNRLHILKVEYFIGHVDIFFSSDWVQPPTKAKNVSIVYDLIVYKYPEETHNQFRFSFKKMRIAQNIVASQKRRLFWVKKECDAIFCISESTKSDAVKLLKIPESKLHVIYPGVTV